MYHEASLLLGHTGALVRKMLTEGGGYLSAAVLAIIWLTAPALIARQKFAKNDF